MVVVASVMKKNNYCLLPSVRNILLQAYSAPFSVACFLGVQKLAKEIGELVNIPDISINGNAFRVTEYVCYAYYNTGTCWCNVVFFCLFFYKTLCRYKGHSE